MHIAIACVAKMAKQRKKEEDVPVIKGEQETGNRTWQDKFKPFGSVSCTAV